MTRRSPVLLLTTLAALTGGSTVHAAVPGENVLLSGLPGLQAPSPADFA